MAKTVRTYNDVLAEIQAVQAEYHEKANIASAAELRSLSSKMKALRQEASSLITDGAMPCPECGELPHGMFRERGRGMSIYEIGCLNCKNPDDESQALRAVGTTQKSTVFSWNEADYYLI